MSDLVASIKKRNNMSHMSTKKKYFPKMKMVYQPFSRLLNGIQNFYDKNKTTIEEFFKNSQISALVNTGLNANETNAITSFAHEMEQYLKAKFVFKEDEPSNKRDAYYRLYTDYAKKLTYKSKISEGVIKTLVLLYFFRQFTNAAEVSLFYEPIFDYKKEDNIVKGYKPIFDKTKEDRLVANYDKAANPDWTRLNVKDICDENKYFNSNNEPNNNYYKNNKFYVQETGDLKIPQYFYDNIMNPKLILITKIDKIGKSHGPVGAPMTMGPSEEYTYKINDNIIVTAIEKVYTKKGVVGGKRTQKRKRRSKKRKTSRKTRRKHY